MNLLSILLGIVGTLALGIIGSLIASFLYPPAFDRFAALLVKVLGWFPTRHAPRFAGVWKSIWEVNSPSYSSPSIDEHVVIRQLGKRIYAKSRAGKSHYFLIGTVDEGRYITGTWFDETQGGYHGAFQFVVNPATGNFDGLWIGFSKTGIVKHGLWTWERKT